MLNFVPTKYLVMKPLQFNCHTLELLAQIWEGHFFLRAWITGLSGGS